MSTTPTALTTFERIMADWRTMCEENRRLTAENAAMLTAINDLTAQVVGKMAKNTTLRMENQRLTETVQEQKKIIDRLDAKLADACRRNQEAKS